MPSRHEDWLRQAKKDINTAKKLKEECIFEWSCFISQQSAEKAIKAVYQKLNGEAWGHSLYGLLKGLEEKIEVPKEVFNCAKTLDKFYIPSRYPNGLVSGTPYEYFNEEDAKDAISCGEEILRFCEDFLAEPTVSNRRTNKKSKET
ncbi:TPA: DNA-binding protein [bacterium]|nr:DNA-binding protein [bacterium]